MNNEDNQETNQHKSTIYNKQLKNFELNKLHKFNCVPVHWMSLTATPFHTVLQ